MAAIILETVKPMVEPLVLHSISATMLAVGISFLLFATARD